MNDEEFQAALNDPKNAVQLDAASSRAIWNWIIDDGLAPHADLIARIISSGDIACVFFNVHEANLSAAQTLGFTGEGSVLRMSNAVRKRFVERLRATGDTVTVNWLERKARNRIFLMVELASFLINVEPGKGIQLEPGSLQTLLVSGN